MLMHVNFLGSTGAYNLIPDSSVVCVGACLYTLHKNAELIFQLL